jgi:hypothetical protein
LRGRALELIATVEEKMTGSLLENITAAQLLDPGAVVQRIIRLVFDVGKDAAPYSIRVAAIEQFVAPFQQVLPQRRCSAMAEAVKSIGYTGPPRERIIKHCVSTMARLAWCNTNLQNH